MMHCRTRLWAGALVLAAGVAAPRAQAQSGEWRQFRPSNTGVPGVQLHDGRFAPDGRLWVAGRWPFWGEGGYGIYDLQSDTWETLSNVDTPQPSQWARQVVFAPAGAGGDVVWMATDDGLARREGETWTIYSSANSPLLHNKIRNIARAPDGKLWVNNSGVNTNNAALFSFDGTNWVRYRVGEQIPFATPWYQLGVVLVTPDGDVWVSNETLNGVAHFNGSTWVLRGENIGRFGSGLVDHSGDLWFVAGTGGGNSFWRYRRQANQWDHFSPANTPFVNTTITRLGIDQQGRVYCGNWAGQVIRFEGGAWLQVADVGDAVYGIAPAANGDLWIVTLGNGQTGAVHHVNAAGASVRIYNTYNTGVPDYTIDNFNLDPQGNLWLATGSGGLSRYDGVRWRNWGRRNAGSEPYPFGGNDPMGAFFMDQSGMGWMGGNGIARWSPATGAFDGFWNWQNNPGMGVTLFTSFAQDSAGVLFSASRHGQVYQFNGSIWVQQPPTPGGSTSNYAGVKAEPPTSPHPQRVWSIGRFNAFLWDGASWLQVGQQWDLFGKGGANVYDFAPDGTLYIGTNEGLLRVSEPPSGPHALYTPLNSPLPAKQVQGVDVRPDGVVAVSAHLFQSTTPFPTGVAVIAGDINTSANWTIYRYGVDPIRHYQLGKVKWDAHGNLWISAISEGASVLLSAPAAPCYANCDGSTVAPILNVEDFSCFINEFASAQALPHAQQIGHYANCDASTTAPVLNVEDFSCFINRFAAGCR
jgi:sugar lactone lactonase YvrE